MVCSDCGSRAKGKHCANCGSFLIRVSSLAAGLAASVSPTVDAGTATEAHDDEESLVGSAR